MDKQRAKAILSEQMSQLRSQTYSQLKEFMGNSQHLEITAPSGKEYQLEFESWWDDKQESNLRVVVSIDDRGLRAFFPLTNSFIIAPDGSFVGETAEVEGS